MRDTLLKIFEELNSDIVAENLDREDAGTLKVQPVEILVLGQMTLLANDMVAKVLPLLRTGDLDAVIKNTHHFVQNRLRKEILPKYNLVYDDDSEKIWIPSGSHFEFFCDFPFVRAKLLDPESALVSKAIKSPKKNKVLIVDAIASDLFPNLIERILQNKGDLEYFLGKKNET